MISLYNLAQLTSQYPTRKERDNSKEAKCLGCSQFPPDGIEKKKRRKGKEREREERRAGTNWLERLSRRESGEINSDRDGARQHAANCTRILNNGYWLRERNWRVSNIPSEKQSIIEWHECPWFLTVFHTFIDPAINYTLPPLTSNSKNTSWSFDL